MRLSGRRTWMMGAAVAVAVTALIAILVLRSLTGRTPGPPADLQGANILLITLDTTRADRIGAYGYGGAQTPNLDRLAGEGILFEHCITPSAFTLPSHSSIMTGMYPPYHGVRLNGDAGLADVHTTLAEHLGSRGYRTGAFIGAFVLDGRWGLEQGFDHYDDEFDLEPDQTLDLAGVQRPANLIVDAALQWLETDEATPFFAWLHFYDAHAPYAPPEPYRSRFGSDPSSQYDGEIAFADSQVGRLLEWLASRGLDRNTIVVVVGDHGEALGSHGESEHGYFIYDYAVKAPLIVRIPSAGLAGKRIASQVRTIDVFPTILELLGIPAEAQGESVWPLIAGQTSVEPRYAYSESMATRLQYGWSALYSVRTEQYKYIDAPRAELYDLESDPGETNNRLTDLRRVTHQMREELSAIRASAAEGAPEAAEANLDDETVAQLSALGYLGGSSAIQEDDRDLPDPKDKLLLYEGVNYAAQLLIKDDFGEAVEVLERVLDEDPEVPQAQLLLVSAYRKTGETAKAKSILDRYLKKDAGNPRALIAMAEILSEEGRDEDVIAICRRALAEDERNARAWELIADVYIDRNDHENALPNLRKVVEIQPKLTRSRNNLAASLIGVGELDEAETLLLEIVKQFPRFPLARYHLGLLREGQGRLQEARKEYETEVENHPDSVVARFNLGNLLFGFGEFRGAEKQMRALLERDPRSARAHLMLARALLKGSGPLAEAETSARAGLDLTAEHELKALGYFLLADIYSRQGRRAALEEALRLGRHHQSLMSSRSTLSSRGEPAASGKRGG